MRRIVLAVVLLLFLSASLLAGSGPAPAPQPTKSVAERASSDQVAIHTGLFGALQFWLVDLLGLGPDAVDDEDSDKEPLLDDGRGSGSGHRPAEVTADNGWIDIID